MAYRRHSLITTTQIRRTTSSLNASINRYIREKEKQLALQSAQRGFYQLKTESEVFTTIHEDLVSLRSVSKAQRQLDNLVLDKYDRPSYSVPKPDLNSARERVTKEARKQIRSILFWKNREKREEYVSSHLSERLVEYTKEWEADRDLFEKHQDEKEKDYNEKALADYNSEKRALEDFLIQSDNEILNKADKLLADIELPFDISTSLSFEEKDGTLFFDIEFPGEDIIPIQKGSLLKSGKLSIKDKTQKERHYDYVMAICGTAYKVAAEAFNISARVNAVAVSGHSVRMNDKTATISDDYLYSVVFDRNTFTDVVESGDFIPHLKFVSFPHKISLTSQYLFKSINPAQLDEPSGKPVSTENENSFTVNIPGIGSALKFTITSNIPDAKSNPNRAFSPNDGSGFDYLGYHDWKDITPSDIKLEDSTSIPEWNHMYVYSRSDIDKAEKQIQEAYLQIRKDFLNGKFYDLSGPGKTNYGFVLFFDLFASYAAGKSDIRKLCKELDVLTIVCGKTERYIKRTFEKCFEEAPKPQEDRDFATAYFNM
jgi:hypothetical protein